MARNNLRESPRKQLSRITATEHRAGQFSEIKINGYVGHFEHSILPSSRVQWLKEITKEGQHFQTIISCDILCFGGEESDFFGFFGKTHTDVAQSGCTGSPADKML